MADQGGLTRPEARPPAEVPGGSVEMPETGIETPLEAPGPEPETERLAEVAAVEQERIQAAATPVAQAAPVADPLLKSVEQALEEGLQDAYLAMDPPQRARFRTVGERTASRIRAMLSRGHLKFKLVWKLIRDWLKTIPGASRFFVEQEAKIKTDRIIHLAEKQKRR